MSTIIGWARADLGSETGVVAARMDGQPSSTELRLAFAPGHTELSTLHLDVYV
jgi:hypothetical protein